MQVTKFLRESLPPGEVRGLGRRNETHDKYPYLLLASGVGWSDLQSCECGKSAC